MRAGVDYIGVSVGALILNKEGKILLGKRSNKTRNERGAWEAPGGAVEFGERRIDAIKREMKEELGVDIHIVGVLHTADEIIKKDKQHWIPTTYIARIKDHQVPKIMEPVKCDAIGWFSLSNLPKPLSGITKININEYKKQYKLKAELRRIYRS
jgi:ADP-ribose pyrophosphatase YjhB (NUDIX family)